MTIDNNKSTKVKKFYVYASVQLSDSSVSFEIPFFTSYARDEAAGGYYVTGIYTCDPIYAEEKETLYEENTINKVSEFMNTMEFERSIFDAAQLAIDL